MKKCKIYDDRQSVFPKVGRKTRKLFMVGVLSLFRLRFHRPMAICLCVLSNSEETFLVYHHISMNISVQVLVFVKSIHHTAAWF